jgi:ketosteroid isomerase-like protein
MSRENLAAVRRALDAFNRRDREAWLALCHPEFETVPSPDWPETDPIRGREAAWDFYVQTDEPWVESPYEFVEVIHAGSDKVAAHMRREMRGRTSGAGVTYDYWVVFTLRDGKAVRAEWFSDRAGAMEAAHDNTEL